MLSATAALCLKFHNLLPLLQFKYDYAQLYFPPPFLSGPQLLLIGTASRCRYHFWPSNLSFRDGIHIIKRASCNFAESVRSSSRERTGSCCSTGLASRPCAPSCPRATTSSQIALPTFASKVRFSLPRPPVPLSAGWSAAQSPRSDCLTKNGPPSSTQKRTRRNALPTSILTRHNNLRRTRK